MTTSVDRPVTSSICLATVTPSSTFSNFTVPGVFGDDRAGMRIPGGEHRAGLDRLAVGRRSASRRKGTLWRSRSRPLSSVIMISPEREITIFSPLALVT